MSHIYHVYLSPDCLDESASRSALETPNTALPSRRVFVPIGAEAHSMKASGQGCLTNNVGALCSLPRQAWDLAVDICLSQLPTIIEEGTAFRVSPHFKETPPQGTLFLHCRHLVFV